MLLTITHTGENTANIGFLFHKNPARPQVFDLNYGSAFVFYPEVSAEKTTIALLLAIVKFRLFINLFNKQIRLSFLRMRMLFTPTAQTPISSLPTPD
ncbi:MAG: hypothetical protein LBQ81_10760 [Zoogloeaceae bacterium]|nr:hypothetical protein [Zoogloeaceae bacterium]